MEQNNLLEINYKGSISSAADVKHSHYVTAALCSGKRELRSFR